MRYRTDDFVLTEGAMEIISEERSFRAVWIRRFIIRISHQNYRLVI